jgi:hypothetical protein
LALYLLVAGVLIRVLASRRRNTWGTDLKIGSILVQGREEESDRKTETYELALQKIRGTLSSRVTAASPKFLFGDKNLGNGLQ